MTILCEFSTRRNINQAGKTSTDNLDQLKVMPPTFETCYIIWRVGIFQTVTKKMNHLKKQLTG